MLVTSHSGARVILDNKSFIYRPQTTVHMLPRFENVELDYEFLDFGSRDVLFGNKIHS